ncbi:putative AAA family ATPase [Blattamonas nauphoetae]|uniref:AAA family ATPase n=1 Tax=Blattamonas nauphoetae TaxID=2049346 RepID=A0ABQ9YCE2_9EUKA|nr:putative AAA family ATPase [Blattamonas nauphoetae]
MDRFFSHPNAKPKLDPETPLASKLRPSSLSQFVGQQKFLSDNRNLRARLESDTLPSTLIHGPPGCGKTTFAHIASLNSKKYFVKVSAITANTQFIRSVLKEAQKHIDDSGIQTILFVDEIHQLSKKLQEQLVGMIEKQIIILIGATTEDPSFVLHRPLVDKCTVLHFQEIGSEDLKSVLWRGLSSLSSNPYPPRDAAASHQPSLPRVLQLSHTNPSLNLSNCFVCCPVCGCLRFETNDEVLELIVGRSNGDCRSALGMLEMIARRKFEDRKKRVAEQWNMLKVDIGIDNSEAGVQIASAQQSTEINEGEKRARDAPPSQQSEPPCSSPYHPCITLDPSDCDASLAMHTFHDRHGESHYNIISAVHKSARGNDPDATLYYTTRMIQGGEPKFALRRLVQFSGEDVGFAKTSAVSYATAIAQEQKLLEKEDGEAAIALLAAQMATDPKNVDEYTAQQTAMRFATANKASGLEGVLALPFHNFLEREHSSWRGKKIGAPKMYVDDPFLNQRVTFFE